MNNKKKILSNLDIKSEKIRLIDEKGDMVGVISLTEGIKLAEEKKLDLVQITENVEPPVCKIIDLGKYLYNQEKKEKKAKKQSKAEEIKGIRISFKIADYDMKTSAEKAKNFLENGNKVKIEMVLRGREKYLDAFWKEKLKKFLEIINDLIEIKIEKEMEKGERGASLVISKK